MSHLDDGLIQELIDGEVPSHDLPPIQAHLASCATCTARLEEARELAGEADTMLGWLDEEIASTGAVAPAPDIAPQPRVATWPRNLAWAASLVLAVGLGYTARGGMVSPPSSPTTTLDRGATTEQVTQPTEARPAGENRPTERASAPASSENQIAAEPQAASPTPEVSAEEVPRSARRDADASPVPPAANLGRAAPAASSPAAAANPAGLGAPSPARAEREAPRQRLLAADEASGDARMAGAREVAKAASSPVRTADSTGTPAGPLFLISGMDPVRFDISDTEARVVYRHADGEVQLVQRRLGEQVTWHLEAPAGFPAESLAALAGRVR
ncbi:MAG: hypothetical protein AB7N73_04735 [Gemmatimonadales bacterium]